MSINFKKLLWICPFVSFLAGYIAMSYWLHIADVTVPSLIGKYIHEVLPVITNNNLNIRLIDQKEEPNIPAGIILNQIPKAGTLIKPHQPLFIIISKKPPSLISPHCIGKLVHDLIPYFQQTSLHYRIYYIPHPYPEQMCFAQFPSSGEFLEKNNLILYISAGNNRPLLWPNLIGKPLQSLTDFFAHYPIELHIINDTSTISYTENKSIIYEQRPFAGTLISLDKQKPLFVQLRTKQIKENYE